MRLNHGLVTLLAVVICMTILPITSQANSNAQQIDSDDLSAWASEFFVEQLPAHNIPGAALVVVQDGEVLLLDAYGEADPINGVPFDPQQTVFDTASITKLFVYLSVLQLLEEGLIALDDPVNQYLGAYQVPEGFGVPVTIKHLMLHTEGFEETLLRIAIDGSESTAPTMTTEEFLLTRPIAQTHEPGTVLTYGSQATIVAAYLVERVTGQTLTNYVHENFFEPLDMERTAIVQPVPPDLRDDLTPGYLYQDGEYIVHPNMFWHVPAGGGISSTAADMSHLLIALTNGGSYDGHPLVTEDTMQMLYMAGYRPHPEMPGTTYGMLEYIENGQRMVRRDGNAPATINRLVVLPEANLAWFLVSNGDNSELRNTFDTALLDRYFPAGDPDPTIADSVDDVERFIGPYRMTQFNDTSITRLQVWFAGQLNVSANADGTLTITPSGFGDAYGGFEGPTHIRQIGPLLFERVDAPGYIAFVEDNSGDIAYLYSGSGYLGSYYPLPWYEQFWFQFGVAIVTGIVLLSTVVWFFVQRPQSGLARWAHHWGWAVALIGLAVLGGTFPAIFLPEMTPSGFPGYIYEVSSMTVAFLTVALLLIPLSVGQVLFTTLLWLRWQGSMLLRVHSLMIAAAALLLLWQANLWNLIGYQY